MQVPQKKNLEKEQGKSLILNLNSYKSRENRTS